MDMGQSHSVIKNVRPGLIVTLDAQGTIYRFRKPIADQYIEVAQRCGLKPEVQPAVLDKAFRKSFKSISAEFPNYGKGQLSSPKAWWKTVVNDAFRQVVDEKEIPEDLGVALYDHFTSGIAYELYPDVKPFLSSIRELKNKWSKPDDPFVFVGVITNSDPRVRNILQSLSLRVGVHTKGDTDDPSARFRKALSGNLSPEDATKTAWYDIYDSLNDIDFLSTSYEAGAEKPHEEIYQHAFQLATANCISRYDRQRTDFSPSIANINFHMHMRKMVDAMRDSTFIHIGDEFKKDYLGAKEATWEALHLAREGESQAELDESIESVADLEQAAIVVRMLAEQRLGNDD